MGIHTGTLGFLTDYTKQEIHLFLHGLFNKKPQLEEFPLLEITLPEKKETFYAFNEIRIESIAKTVHLNIYIDGEFFEKTTGSGICISTQNGFHRNQSSTFWSCSGFRFTSNAVIGNYADCS